MSAANDQGWILLTNDDGIEAPGFRLLVQALNKAGHGMHMIPGAFRSYCTSSKVRALVR